ncbi:MAG: glycosyltransferase [Cyclobacteriaceae bacterium]|nr:glycosyltransferase [Cyclobacteriaceae bacterium]
MRILHVISSLEVGGAEKMVVTIANASVQAGHTVGVCLLVNRGPLATQLDSRVQVYELNRQWRFDWRALRALASLARQYDLLHVHQKHNAKYVYVVHLLFGVPVPVLLHDHSAEVLVEGLSKTELPFFVVWWLRKQHYLAVSEQLLQWAVANFGLNPVRAHSLGNAIECKPMVEERKEADVVKLLLVSNFRRIKNIEFAVALVAEMIERNMNVTLDIVGKPLDKIYYIEISTMIRSLGLSDRIQIREDISDISSIIPAYSLGIHCSRAETGPLVLLEFMCGGLPFVASNSGGVSADVSEYLPQLIVSDFSVQEWIHRISLLRSDLGALKRRIGLLFEDLYSVKRYQDQVFHLYHTIID